MIKSPFQLNKYRQDAKLIEGLTRLVVQLIEIHKRLFLRLEEINITIDKKTGPKGEAGVPGKDGIPGKNGEMPLIDDIVALTLQNIKLPENGKDGVTPIRGVHYFTEEDINIIKEELMVSLTKHIDTRDPESLLHVFTKKGKKLSVKHIDGLEQTLSAFSNQLGRGYLHGGGDTVKAGTGITIVNNSDGTKTIIGNAGVGAWTTPPETPDGSISIFTVGAVPPTDVIADGIMMFDGVGYTFAAGQIIFINPPAQYVKYR